MHESTLYESLEQTVLANTDACLALDADGEIRACNSPAKALLGGFSAELCGQPVTTLIPALPLRRNTRGYNLAYVGVWYANGARRRLLGVSLDGQALALEIEVNVLKAEKAHAYLVGMHSAAAEPSLRQRIRELEQSLDGAAEAAMITDMNGTIGYVNTATRIPLPKGAGDSAHDWRTQRATSIAGNRGQEGGLS